MNSEFNDDIRIKSLEEPIVDALYKTVSGIPKVITVTIKKNDMVKVGDEISFVGLLSMHTDELIFIVTDIKVTRDEIFEVDNMKLSCSFLRCRSCQ